MSKDITTRIVYLNGVRLAEIIDYEIRDKQIAFNFIITNGKSILVIDEITKGKFTAVGKQKRLEPAAIGEWIELP